MKIMRVRLAFTNGDGAERFMEKRIEFDPETQDSPAVWSWDLLPSEEGWVTVTDVRFISAVEVTGTKADREWNAL